MNVALLNCSPNPDRTRENFFRIFDAVETAEIDAEDYRLEDGSFPDADAIDGGVISGSRYGVYDDEPFIGRLREWIQDAELPLLGVCYGHQAIADAYGGTVVELDEGELGFCTVEHENDPLFEGVPETFTTWQSHGDGVVEPPAEAEIIAENEVTVQAMRIDGNVTVQFHPEIDAEYGREIVESVAENGDRSSDELDEIRANITDENDRAAAEVHAIFDNFFERVAKHR